MSGTSPERRGRERKNVKESELRTFCSFANQRETRTAALQQVRSSSEYKALCESWIASDAAHTSPATSASGAEPAAAEEPRGRVQGNGADADNALDCSSGRYKPDAARSRDNRAATSAARPATAVTDG